MFGKSRQSSVDAIKVGRAVSVKEVERRMEGDRGTREQWRGPKSPRKIEKRKGRVDKKEEGVSGKD